MTTPREELRRRAQEETRALRALEQASFDSGGTAVLGVAPLPVVITPEIDRRRPGLHSVAIGSLTGASAVVQRLACGVLNSQGEIVGVGRTNRNGMLWVQLPAGRYTIRCVDEVRGPVDVEILERIGDDRAEEQLDGAAALLDAAAGGGASVAALRQAVQDALAAVREAWDDQPSPAGEVGLPPTASSPYAAAAGRATYAAEQATALGNGGSLPSGAAEIASWDLVVDRRDTGESATVTVLWRGGRGLQLLLRGFLLPDEGQRVRLEWRSADGGRLAAAGLVPGGGDVVEMTGVARPPGAGDRLRIDKLDQHGGRQWEIEAALKRENSDVGRADHS